MESTFAILFLHYKNRTVSVQLIFKYFHSNFRSFKSLMSGSYVIPVSKFWRWFEKEKKKIILNDICDKNFGLTFGEKAHLRTNSTKSALFGAYTSSMYPSKPLAHSSPNFLFGNALASNSALSKPVEPTPSIKTAQVTSKKLKF